MRPTPLRISIAVVVLGVLIALGGLALGSAPTPTHLVEGGGVEVAPTDEPVSPDIIPGLEDRPRIVRGSPGSREQVALLGGLVAALGVLGVLGSVSAEAARRARGTGPAVPAQ